MVHAGLLACESGCGFGSNELSTNIRLLQRAFPGCPFTVAVSRLYPVASRDFLAYSCAAARDLHPLPIVQRGAGLRSCANLHFEKEQKPQPSQFTGRPDAKSNARTGPRALPARTNFPQIEPRINSQIVFIVPRKLQRVLAYRLRRQRFHRRLEHWQSSWSEFRRLARLSP
jgi:hypothetical protein